MQSPAVASGRCHMAASFPISGSILSSRARTLGSIRGGGDALCSFPRIAASIFAVLFRLLNDHRVEASLRLEFLPSRQPGKCLFLPTPFPSGVPLRHPLRHFARDFLSAQGHPAKPMADSHDCPNQATQSQNQEAEAGKQHPSPSRHYRHRHHPNRKGQQVAETPLHSVIVALPPFVSIHSATANPLHALLPIFIGPRPSRSAPAMPPVYTATAGNVRVHVVHNGKAPTPSPGSPCSAENGCERRSPTKPRPR